MRSSTSTRKSDRGWQPTDETRTFGDREQAERQRCLAAKLDGAGGDLRARRRSCCLRPAVVAGPRESASIHKPGWVGEFSQFFGGRIVRCGGIPLAALAIVVAAAQPADCDVRFYRRDP